MTKSFVFSLLNCEGKVLVIEAGDREQGSRGARERGRQGEI
jgi:hypothetical protein